jgi:hypothetical protein
MECTLPETNSHSIDSIARMYTDDLVDVLIKEYYLLREQYNAVKENLEELQDMLTEFNERQ